MTNFSELRGKVADQREQEPVAADKHADVLRNSSDILGAALDMMHDFNRRLQAVITSVDGKSCPITGPYATEGEGHAGLLIGRCEQVADAVDDFGSLLVRLEQIFPPADGVEK